MADEPAGIGLLVDQRERGLHAEQMTIDAISDAQIRRDDFRRHQRPDDLGIARTDQLDAAGGDQIAKTRDPGGIALLDFFERVAGRLDADRTVRRGQRQQRPIAALDDRGALALFDRGEGEVEMEQREEMQRGGLMNRCRRTALVGR